MARIIRSILGSNSVSGPLPTIHVHLSTLSTGTCQRIASLPLLMERSAVITCACESTLIGWEPHRWGRRCPRGLTCPFPAEHGAAVHRGPLAPWQRDKTGATGRGLSESNRRSCTPWSLPLWFSRPLTAPRVEITSDAGSCQRVRRGSVPSEGVIIQGCVRVCPYRTMFFSYG